MMRNEGKNFTEYESAIMFQRFRDKFGYTQSEIAQKFGKSITFIGRCLSLLDLAPEIQEKIEKGEISTGAVRQIVELNKDDEAAQVAAVQDAVDDAKSKGKKSATVKNIGGDTKSQKDLKKVVSGIKILIEATVQAKLHIEDMSARELIAALHNAESMEDVIAKLNGSPEPEKEPQSEELSPMMKQFQELKATHPDATILFRCGDFYETYQDDAEVVAKTLGITLTKKDDIKMAGFPYHALDQYLPKLIRHGMRVAICDQLEAPKAKSLVKSGVTDIVSPQ